MERGAEEAEPEEEEEGGRCAEGLDEGGCSSIPPPLRFFTRCSKPLPPPCPCSPESPPPGRPWELVAEDGSGGEEWARGGCVLLYVHTALAAGECDSEGEGWGRGLLLGESVPLVCPCGRSEGAGVLDDDDEEPEEGGRPRSWRMMQFLSGPECSPSWEGAFRLRRAAAAAASSRSFSICLLGRPTGFRGRPEAAGCTDGGFP